MRTGRLLWIAGALGGAACVVATFLPAFQVRLEASIGGGDTQQGFDYVRTWSLVEYGTGLAIAAVVATVLLIVVAAAGVRVGTTTALLVALGIIALGLAAFTTAAGFNEDMLGGFGSGQESCPSWSDCGGAVLGPAVRELHRDVLQKPEAKDPEYLHDPGYAAEPRPGWRVIQLVANVLLVVGAFALFHKRRELQVAGPVFAVLGVVAIAFWDPDTTYGLSSSASAEGEIALYGALLAGIAAVAALLSKRWKLGAATLVLALASGFFVWLVLFAAGEN